jgi:type I restriction enzyme S subunit
MRGYPKYKPSDIECIGEIPKDWQVWKLKNLVRARLKYGANEAAELDDVNLPRYIRITDFGDDGQLRDTTFKSLPFDIAKEYFLKEGDILFARSGATVGKTMLFENYSGNACFAGYLIMARCDSKKVLYKFLYYYTKTQNYDSWKKMIFIENTIQNIGADKYNLLPVPVPNIEQQQQIADFLDYKTEQCDRFIVNRQKQIELLNEQKASIINKAVTKGINANVKMKSSGIDWLEKIPEHWELIKLKYVAKLQSGETISADNIKEVDNFPVFGGNGLRGYTDSYTNSGEFILIGRQGALCGNINYASGKFWASEHAIVTYLKRPTNIFWLGELLRTMNLNQYSQAAAQPGLSVDKIKILPIPCPNYQEQNEIELYIKKETSTIETLISKYQKQIDLMREYRTALISQAVTGKIDVREWKTKTKEKTS